MKDIIIFKKNLYLYIKNNKDLNKIISTFDEFDVQYYIIGGAIRSLIKEEKPRDIDIIIDKSDSYLKDFLNKNNFIFHKNTLGGYKINNFIDLWSIENHYMFKKNIYNILLPENILYTTFNSYDSILYDKTNNILYDDFYQKTNKNKKIYTVGNDESILMNPNITLSIIKLYKLEFEYKYKLSSQFFDIIEYYIKTNINIKNECHIKNKSYTNKNHNLNTENNIKTYYNNIVLNSYYKHYNKYPKKDLLSFILDNIYKMILK